MPSAHSTHLSMSRMLKNIFCANWQGLLLIHHRIAPFYKPQQNPLTFESGVLQKAFVLFALGLRETEREKG